MSLFEVGAAATKTAKEATKATMILENIVIDKRRWGGKLVG